MKGQWGRLAGYFVGTLLVSAAVTFGLPLLGGGSWLPELISTEGGAIDELFWGLLILSLVIFAIVGAIVIYSIVHFRAEPGDMGDGEHIHGNAKMEVAWIIIPSIIVSVIAVLSFIVMNDNEVGLFDKSRADDKGAATMQVDVRGFSFGWEFRYEDKDGKALAAAPTGELVLPLHEVVRFNVFACSGTEHLGRIQEETLRELSSHGHENEFAEVQPSICEKEWDTTTAEDRTAVEEQTIEIRAAQERKADGKKLTHEQEELLDSQPIYHGDQQYMDVNHAFWVPEARLKVDAISGLRTYVQWEPSRVTGPEDRFQVVCAELCGSGHNGMRTDMCVVDGDTFKWWLKLDEETRGDASCVNLRMFQCFEEKIADRDALLSDIAKLTKKDPDAGCDEATEEIA